MYYTIDCEGVTGARLGVAGQLSRLNMKHQHSLESYQLYKEKVSKIREKQAAMPGWDGSRTPGPAPSPASVRCSSSLSRARQCSNPPPLPPVPTSPDTGGSMPRLSSQTRLNSLQMGLAAIFNPDNYLHQQTRKLPFIPGKSTNSSSGKIIHGAMGLFTVVNHLKVEALSSFETDCPL